MSFLKYQVILENYSIKLVSLIFFDLKICSTKVITRVILSFDGALKQNMICPLLSPQMIIVNGLIANASWKKINFFYTIHHYNFVELLILF